MIVSTGKFQLRTEGNTDNIWIYGEKLGYVWNGGGSGDFDRFLNDVGQYIHRRMASGVLNPPKDLPQWAYNGGLPGFEPDEEHDLANVLKHITEQTGLTFTEETRSVPVLFVERAK